MGDLTRLKQGPEATTQCVQLIAGQDMAASFPSGAGGGYQLQGELRAVWLIGYQQRSTSLIDPLISYKVVKVRKIISWGLGQACRKGS